MTKVFVIIPALNEALSIGKVIGDIPREWVSEIVVVDNGSTDETPQLARAAGATVLTQNEKGYGAACLLGIEYVTQKNPEVLVFLDGDYSDYPEDMVLLLREMVAKNADLVIGSRVLGQREKGSLTPQQIFGNWLATTLLKIIYGQKFTDLGPFRAIRFEKLLAMEMKDRNYGWTVEMQIKAAKNKFVCAEVPVRYRNRIGKSKVSGTVKGSIMAGYKILLTLFRYL